jgi:hypothetical protein
MKPTFRKIRFFSVAARRAEEAHAREQDREQVRRGRAAAVQAANRLIPNPRQWHLEAPECLPAKEQP